MMGPMPRRPQCRPAENCAHWPGNRHFPIAAALICAGLAICSGCNVFTQPVATAGPPALNWLTNLVTPSLDLPPSVDLTTLKPSRVPAPLKTGDLLEITVWDLYEPG